MQVYPDSALFLDRDGVINLRLEDDYVKRPEEFVFCDRVPQAIARFSGLFSRIFIVSNQQGIGKGLMSWEALNRIHDKMLEEIGRAGGRVDRIYVCPDLKRERSFYRKPQVGMGLQAARDFKDFAFRHSFMAGDTRTDMEFGKRLGMTTVLIGSDSEALRPPLMTDYSYASLWDFASVWSR